MTREEKIIRNKVGVLGLAKQLGSVSQACRLMGSRDSFYRFKDLYEKGGEAALIEMSRRVPPRPLLAMAGSPLGRLDQARLPQLGLGSGVAVCGLGLDRDPLLEVFGIEVEVAGPVLLQHPLDPVHQRRPASGQPRRRSIRPSAPSVSYLSPQPPKMPLRYPQHLHRSTQLNRPSDSDQAPR